MINLFNIPNHNIDTSDFNHYLHGDIVEEFESNFRDYVVLFSPQEIKLIL